ncbi:hypothetical protein FDECE_10036 [Fusarium decemcellulare]|nr:hypothetical protein FDECE_10036 [Fusarium decemcellulare]
MLRISSSLVSEPTLSPPGICFVFLNANNSTTPTFKHGIPFFESRKYNRIKLTRSAKWLSGCMEHWSGALRKAVRAAYLLGLETPSQPQSDQDPGLVLRYQASTGPRLHVFYPARSHSSLYLDCIPHIRGRILLLIPDLRGPSDPSWPGQAQRGREDKQRLRYADLNPRLPLPRASPHDDTLVGATWTDHPTPRVLGPWHHGAWLSLVRTDSTARRLAVYAFTQIPRMD